MEPRTVRDMMVPISDHATISENATLQEAAVAFEKASRGDNPQARNIVLVLGSGGEPVGEINDLDVLRSLEPGYKAIGDLRSTSLSGLNTEFLTTMLQKYNLWQDPLGALCEKAAGIRVEQVDYKPVSGQYVTEDTPLNQAIHLLIVGQHESLLVMGTGGEGLVGVLHRRAVFRVVLERIKACKL